MLGPERSPEALCALRYFPSSSMATWVPLPEGKRSLQSERSVSLTTSARFFEVSIFKMTSWLDLRFTFVMMTTGCPVVISPYMPAAEMPMPCWPLDIFILWNLEP